ncbi:DNA-dependent protein kinase catalytic subunit-like isoform X2 [Toxorhynchites rutilus septentrionalis]|uniref:DNA-dependent protein kinase catalytic subunit-like isoform X2 n=1 Tax=Toxorhynchites rutilus septentrionalis TaxID=329112 RepID=UPI0024794D96|nr:DNA-dependent protein kinase catalytic subunit-like isoform X2 [Toxorhynchites rutilus septentrionalis]
MSTDLEKYLLALKGYIDTQHSIRAKDCVASITDLITARDTQTSAEAEYSLDIIFNSPNGLLTFLQRSLKSTGKFQKANEEIFDLLRKLIQQHHKLVRKSSETILRQCVHFVQSSSVSARERELATAVMQDLVVYKCLDEDCDMSQLLGDLLVVFDQRKITNRFQQILFELIGLLAKDYPECVSEERQNKILYILMSVAEGQLLEESYPSLISLAGALRGLNYFLVNFAPTQVEGEEFYRKIYMLVKKLSDCDEAVRDRQAFRNALQLFDKHCALFSSFLYADHQYWQQILTTKWIRSGVEDRKVGMYALHSLHRELAREILKRENQQALSSDDNTESRIVMLNYYMKYFKTVLLAPDSKPFEVRIAIRGFGSMSEACGRLMSEQYMNELLLLVMQRTEYVYLMEDKSRDLLEHLPDFVQALSDIMSHVRELTGVQLASLQNIIIGLFKDFHYLSSIHHELIISSLMKTFDNLRKLGGRVLDTLLDKVVFRGLIWTCSHTLVFDANQDANADEQSNWKDYITYKHYLPLWRGLLSQGVGYSFDRGPLIKDIYNQLFKSLFLILDKLDLSTRKRTLTNDTGEERELFLCDPNLDLTPVKPKDFHIFFNLVDFYQDLFRYNKATRENFVDWISTYFDYMVKKSIKHPLISGFVKMIELGMITANHLQYFQIEESYVKMATINLLVYFLELQIAKARNSTGELQHTCLRFVLNAPVTLLGNFLEDSEELIEILRISFRLGKGILGLAHTALSCVQRIIVYNSPISEENREKVLTHILPLLDGYLQTRDANQPSPINARLATFQRKRSVNLTSSKIEKIKLQHALECSDSELVKFQRRILLFLGELEPNMCTRMIQHDTDDTEEAERTLVMWDLDSSCNISLQLLNRVGIRPIIKLETIIARVCTLAVSSIDRKTKVAACELLHALILYIIGIQYQDKMTKLWTELCNHLLQLSTDTDIAVCQMFEPLIFQIIHYLTQPSKINSKGTEVLVGCLMNAISHPTDTAIRDLASRCIREYLLWTIKQTATSSGHPSGTSSSSGVNMTLILEKLRTYSLDSCSSRRKGAALAFNNIYRILREEETHIERSCFELFYVFCVNFVMTEDFDGSVASLEQVSASIDHLTRVLIVRKDMFNRSSENRAVPSVLRGGTLGDLVFWLFGQCSSRETSYRHKCMEIFPKLAASVDGCRSVRDFVGKFLSDSAMRDICDHADVACGIRHAPDFQFIANGNLPMITNIYLWLEYFISSIDMYYWLLSSSLVQNPELFLQQSNIFDCILFFLCSVRNAAMFDLMTLVRPDFVDASHTSIEWRVCTDKIIKYNLLKCFIIVRIIDLLRLVLPQRSCRAIRQSFWGSKELPMFLVDLIFQPQRMGFDFKSCMETIAMLPKNVDEFLEKIERFDNLHFKETVYQQISQKLGDVLKDLSDRLEELMKAEIIGLEDSNFVKGVLMIAKRYDALYKQYFSPRTKVFLEVVSAKILQDVFDGLKEKRLDDWYSVNLTPSVKKFASVVLRIAFIFKSTEGMGVLMELLLNDRKLKPFQQSHNSYIFHGEHFVTTFDETVFEYVLEQLPTSMEKIISHLNDTNFPLIVTLLCSFLEFSYQRKRSSIAILKTVTEYLLKSWEVLFNKSRSAENNFGATDLRLIGLMSNVAMISPIALVQIGKKAVGFREWLLDLIVSPTNTLDLKSKALFLLPTLVGETDFESVAVTEGLQRLQNKHFPLRSSEFIPGSVARISFENCIVALLEAMVVSRSPVILKAVINATAADTDHIAERRICSALEDYMKAQNSNQQCYNLKQIFSTFSDESLEPSVRLTVLRRFLTIALPKCSIESILTFYKLNIKKINEMVRCNYGQLGSGWEAEQALVNRLGGFQLIELYVAVVPRDIILTDDCMVAKALYGESGRTPGNKLITDFTKKAYGSRSEVFLTPDTPTAELFRKYQCAAYRALAAIICNTKDDLQLYNVLLFRENSDKNELIWKKLINCSDDHLYEDFSQELEEYPKIKDRIVSIRRIGSVSMLSSANRFKYIQMTSVFESSLSQDVTKLDLNFSLVRSTQEVAAKEVEEFTSRQQQSSIALERSKINDHEVMATVCAVIQHMHENKITPVPVGDRIVPPPWIKFLSISIRDQQQHKNVRLFLVKVIDNCRIWLRPYAASLIPPMMQIIVDECIASRLNTFITDLIALILEWGDAYQPTSCDEVSLASGMLMFLMRNCFHTRREVFRLNLELVKALIEQWKAVIGVPVQLLYDMIGPAQDPESMQNICGLQLNAIVMANGLVPWTETTKFDFVRAIFRCLDSERTAVYRPASELLGMCLSNLYPAGEEREDDRYQSEFLAKLNALRKKNDKKFMDITFGIHKAFPSIVDAFLPIITHAIPGSTGPSKKIYLEMLLSRVESYKEQVHRELISLDLKGMLRDHSYQLLALHLINKSLSLMSASNIEGLIDSIISLSSNERTVIREIVYEILIFIHENFNPELTDTSRQKLFKALLMGFNDSSQAIEARIFEFWTAESRFPTEIDARFQRILADLYDPSQELNFLGYATQILLDTAVKNPESKRRIFQHEYEADVKLREYTIDTRWQQRHSMASAPLFVESQQRFLVAGNGSQVERLIKATQFGDGGNVFEPTQDPSVMTQTVNNFTLPTQNSLLFDINPPILDRRSRRTMMPPPPAQPTKPYDRLRKRIIKDKERTSREQAQRAIERHSYETVRKTEVFKKKHGEVTLYRRYRIGDFPDLLINSNALLMPLLALCKRDAPLARQVFVAIFAGILEEWEQNDSRESILAINAAIQRIFTQSNICDPNLFGALIEVAMLRPRVFDLSADSVTTIACGANMMTLGVLYLENKLHEYEFPDGSIVSHSSFLSLEALHWIKLAELYHVLNEYDVLADVFSDKMDSDPRLKQAIELESNGNFYKARELYHRLIRENQTRLAEQNFCFQSYYNCYAQMGMWEELIPILEQQVDVSSEELWTDEWNIENILPKYVHANTRLNLAGDERGRGFIIMLEAWMRVPERMEHIKVNFGEDIAMLQMANGEYSRAKLYSDQVLRQFLDEWSYLDVLSDKLRIRKLMDIRKMAEVHMYGHLLSNRLEETQLKKLVANWQHSFPSASDSPIIWDTLLGHRKFVLNKLETMLESCADDNLLRTDFVRELTDAVFETELRLLDASFEQNNLRFARRIIKRLDVVAEEQTERGYRWRVAQLKLKRLSESDTVGKTVSLQRMIGYISRLKSLVEDEHIGPYRKVQVESLHELVQMTEFTRGLLQNVTRDDSSELRRMLLLDEQGTLEEQLGDYSIKCLQKTIDVAGEGILDSSSSTAIEDTTLLAECHYRLAQYCYDGLEKEPIGELQIPCKIKNSLTNFSTETNLNLLGTFPLTVAVVSPSSGLYKAARCCLCVFNPNFHSRPCG